MPPDSSLAADTGCVCMCVCVCARARAESATSLGVRAWSIERSRDPRGVVAGDRNPSIAFFLANRDTSEGRAVNLTLRCAWQGPVDVIVIARLDRECVHVRVCASGADVHVH